MWASIVASGVGCSPRAARVEDDRAEVVGEHVALRPPDPARLPEPFEEQDNRPRAMLLDVEIGHLRPTLRVCGSELQTPVSARSCATALRRSRDWAAGP